MDLDNGEKLEMELEDFFKLKINDILEVRLAEDGIYQNVWAEVQIKSLEYNPEDPTATYMIGFFSGLHGPRAIGFEVYVKDNTVRLPSQTTTKTDDNRSDMPQDQGTLSGDEECKCGDSEIQYESKQGLCRLCEKPFLLPSTCDNDHWWSCISQTFDSPYFMRGGSYMSYEVSQCKQCGELKTDSV